MNDLLNQQGWSMLELAKGTTLMLTIGTLLVYVAKRPAFKQRAAELSVFVTVVWMLLAIVPLPRLAWLNTPAVVTPGSLSSNLDTNVDQTSIAPSTSTLEVDTQGSSLPNSLPLARDSRPVVVNEPLTATSVSKFSITFLFVCACLIVWVVGARIAMVVTCLRASPAPSWCQEIYQAINKRRVARVLVCNRNIRPMSFGLRKPIILLPQRLTDPSMSQAIRHVLLHEQVHVDRRDALGNMVLVMALPLLWFHPLYWYMRYTVDAAREMIADDVAASHSEKHAYVKDLIGLLRQSGVGSVATGAIGVLGFRHPFTKRMVALLERPDRLSESVGRGKNAVLFTSFLCLLFGATATLGARPGIGQDTEDDGDQQESEASQQSTIPMDVQTTLRSEPVVPAATRISKTYDHIMVRPARDLVLKAPEDGRIIQLKVLPGQTIKKGEMIALVANAELEQAIVEAAKSVSILEQTLSYDINERDVQLGLELAQAELALAEQRGREASELAKAMQMVARFEMRVELVAAEKKKQQLELQHNQTLLDGLQQRNR